MDELRLKAGSGTGKLTPTLQSDFAQSLAAARGLAILRQGGKTAKVIRR